MMAHGKQNARWQDEQMRWNKYESTLTYVDFILTPRSRVLLKTLTVTHLAKRFTTFHGNRCFLTVFTTPCYWPLPWARCIQSTQSHAVSLFP